MKKKALTPTILAVAAVALLGFSAVGSTSAALTSQSGLLQAQVTVSDIGVTLNENGTAVSHRNYSNGSWEETQNGPLLQNMVASGETLKLGQSYDEALTVTNSGSIDTYVRVIVDKSWVDPNGTSTTALSPSLINVAWTDSSDWIVVDTDPNDERVVLYYTKPLAPGETTSALSKTLTLDTSIASSAHLETVDSKTVKTVYDYDGYSCCLEAEADAVQAHNDASKTTEDSAAMVSAWGVTPTFSGTTITGIN